jgi:Fe-S-cluster containining protein
MADLAADLSLKVLSIYQEIDQHTARLGLAFGLRCPSLCGACCDSPRVEATVLETLPLAEEIYRRKEEEALLVALEKKRNQDDFKCVLYLPNPGFPGTGRCSYYEFRPLVCRLFGFAFRRNRLGNLEFSACKVMKERPPEAVHRFENGISETLVTPVYQESFMRIASLDPGIGYRCLPINRALREALERLYWKTGRICQISDNETKGTRSVRP